MVEPDQARVPSARQSPEPQTDTLRIGVLGQLVATRAGARLELGGPRQRAVLALLVMARGDVMPADRLVDALWGEATPPSATGALQAYVSHLRKRMEPERGPRERQSVISRMGPGYALQMDADAVDTWRFERLLRQAGAAEPGAAQGLLEEAMQLWRGPAYADYADQTWADPEIARLHGLREVAQEQLLAARLAQGEAAVLVPEIEGLVAADPLREERWRLLVLALYRSHRQADALGALRRARATLADELGVDPGPALRLLEAEVLAQSPALDAPAREPVPPASAAAVGQAPPSTAPGPQPPKDLVDRDAEVATLGATLDEALAGRGRMALIHGPAGIGKSRLLDEARRLGRDRGALVLTARGSQLERDFAFGAVRQLFEATLHDRQRRVGLLQGAAASAASVFGDVPVDPDQRADGSFAVLHGLYWLVVNLSDQQPVVLAVDDLQWCDTGSVRALAFLLRRLEGLPVLVVATLRTGEIHADQALLTEMAQDLSTVPVQPGPIGLDGTSRLVRLRLGDQAHPTFVAACHRTTGGNPLLLLQLLRALEVERVKPDAAHAGTVNAIGSRAVSSMVLMRLAGLPEQCTRVAEAVAVLGDGAELPVVAALAELDETTTAVSIATLGRAELVRTDGELGFVHPLVGEAVAQSMSPAQRELQHETAAGLLRSRRAAAEQVAAHLMLAPRRGSADAVRVLRSAADTAADRGAADIATRYLERAIAEPANSEDRIELLLDLGRLTAMTDGPAALGHLRAAYDTVTDPATRAEVAIMLARTLIFAGEPGEPTAFAREAAAELPPELDDARQALLALERTAAYMHGLPPEDWMLDSPPPRGDGIGARMLSTALAWEELIGLGDLTRCVELAQFALADGALLRTDPGLLWVIATFTQEMSDVDTGDFWERTLAHAFEKGSLFSALAVHLWRGYSMWHQGRLREALASVHASTEQSEQWGAPAVGVAYGQAFMLGIMLEIGDVPAARAYLDSIVARVRIGDGARLLEESHGRVLAAEGRYAEALPHLEAAAQMQTAVLNPVWRPWRTYQAPVLAALGRVEEAHELMSEEIALARAWGAASILGRTLRVAGELGGPDAEALLREALDLLRPSVARWEVAAAELALACVTGDDDERLLLLDAALEGAAACGSPGLYARAAAEVVAAGAPAPPDFADVLVLTSTEKRIAELASCGASSSAIAQELFVTPATVERTLADVRSRLGLGPEDDIRPALESH